MSYSLTVYDTKKESDMDIARKALDRLLYAHIVAWQRPSQEDDFVEQVNATYEAYLAGGGNDEHYNTRWNRLRDVYKRRAARREREDEWDASRLA